MIKCFRVTMREYVTVKVYITLTNCLFSWPCEQIRIKTEFIFFCNKKFLQ